MGEGKKKEPYITSPDAVAKSFNKKCTSSFSSATAFLRLVLNRYGYDFLLSCPTMFPWNKLCGRDDDDDDDDDDADDSDIVDMGLVWKADTDAASIAMLIIITSANTGRIIVGIIIDDIIINGNRNGCGGCDVADIVLPVRPHRIKPSTASLLI